MIGLMTLALLFPNVWAHGDHSFDLTDQTDKDLSYAERHMHTEHHIDSFDLESFFKLHDLDMNGLWDMLEIQAVYGLHHPTVKDKIGEVMEVDERAKKIVKEVLDKLDTNGDGNAIGKISLAEFLAGGNGGLPNFEGYKNLGHHYDEESEYFLHHEELYHSTPDTQTDESYTHPEDIEHFKHHVKIEEEEDARERKFEGLDPEADLSKDHVAADPLEHHAHAPGEGSSENPDTQFVQEEPKAGDEVEPSVKAAPKRVDPGAAPQRIMRGGHAEEFGGLREAAKGKIYGGGRPKTLEERLRSGVPYKMNIDKQLTKYRMRKGLRYDEF
nr:hypothetical protein L203_03620 [Cryptococcus depauperatus CBS 7841]